MHVQIPPGWRRLLPIVLAPAAALGLLLAAWAYTTASAPSPLPAAAAALALPAAAPPLPGLLVYVSGAVAHPGLYRMPRGERAYDAVAAAGGLLPTADTTRMPNPEKNVE